MNVAQAFAAVGLKPVPAAGGLYSNGNLCVMDDFGGHWFVGQEQGPEEDPKELFEANSDAETH